MSLADVTSEGVLAAITEFDRLGDFGYVYGTRGLNYIECHHRTPLHVTGETQTKLSDLALLCSNCHRMIHRTEQWLTVEELKRIVGKQRKLSAGQAAAELGT